MNRLLPDDLNGMSSLIFSEKNNKINFKMLSATNLRVNELVQVVQWKSSLMISGQLRVK